MKAALFVGRWQPCHKGHVWLIRQQLGRGIPCLVLVRNTEPDEHNPYTTEQTVQMLEAAFAGEAVTVMPLPCDIGSVNWGRGVGYQTLQHVPPEGIGYISGTAIRARLAAGKDISEFVDPEVELVLREIAK